MKKTSRKPGSRTGSTLCGVLVIIMAMSSAVGVMAMISQHRSRKATRLADQARAQAIAEAGARYGYSVLATNFSGVTEAQNDMFAPMQLDGGTFDIDIVLVTNGVAAIHSTGVFRDAEQEVILDVGSRGAPGSTNAPPPPDAAYDYAILANQIDWSGGVTITSGWVHANTTFLLGGASDLGGNVSACTWIRINGNGKIVGDAKAPAYKKKAPKNITGNAYKGPVPAVPIPDIDLTPYYNWASANNEVYGDTFLNHTTVQPNGGVMWVNGDLKIIGCTMSGCFIATGDIDIGSHTDQVKVNNLPAFVSRDGTITVRAGTYTRGLLYTKSGDIDVSGNGGGAHLSGSIICAGLFRMRGGYDFFAYENSQPIPPGGSTSTPGEEYVYLKAWQK
jgi:hypothetical protein